MDDLKQFTLSFFQNLRCNVREENGIIFVDNIPREFEEVYGKQGPYCIVFDNELENDNNDYVGRGSVILKAMNDYLSGKGSTTLLKLDFDIGGESELKKHIRVRNCEISRVNKKEEPIYFLRFSFNSILQYLNEKEQLTNDIFVSSGKVIDFDMTKYKIIEGKNREIDVQNIKESYALAREKLKEKISGKIEEIGKILDDKLQKERERIEEHYGNVEKEMRVELEKNEKELKKPANKFREERALENVKRLKGELDKEHLEKEKQFFINDEIRKHSLNLSNKLINTSIIYYPKFILEVYLKKGKSARMVEVQYNPLTGESNDILCDFCKKKMDEIGICDSGHLSCSGCSKFCIKCRSELCKLCRVKSCSQCGNELCKDCIGKCSRCWKDMCKEHLRKDYRTDKACCSVCLKVCGKCGGSTDKMSFKKCSHCGVEMCNRCSVLGFKGKECNNCAG